MSVVACEINIPVFPELRRSGISNPAAQSW